MGAIASQITSPRLFTQTQIKENIKVPRHGPLWGNSPGTGEFPAQMASNAENVSIWLCHHVEKETYESKRFQFAVRPDKSHGPRLTSDGIRRPSEYKVTVLPL